MGRLDRGVKRLDVNAVIDLAGACWGAQKYLIEALEASKRDNDQARWRRISRELIRTNDCCARLACGVAELRIHFVWGRA